MNSFTDILKSLSTNISRGIMENESPKGNDVMAYGTQIYAIALYDYDVVALGTFDHREF